MPLAELAAAVGGRLAGQADPNATVTGPVVIDSRDVVPGALFVAIAGENVDGHDYAAAAHAAGAAAVLATREVGVPAVLVDDPVTALGDLGAHVRARLTGLTAIGVTGSSGKTSTKDLLAQLLGQHGATVAPQNSFNNEIGVPLTLLRCDAGTAYLVSEMGARHLGNIAYLCRIVAPSIGVVLNVGAAHAGEFGSREVTAQTKGELVESLPAEGVAVLNADDPLVAAMASRTAARVITTSASGDRRAGLWAEQVVLDDAARASFTLCRRTGDETGSPAAQADSVPVSLQLHGAHHVANALAVAAVAHAVGMALPEIAGRLGAAQALSAGRMRVGTRADGVIVIDDAYNANPDSMDAALRALAAIRLPAGGRRWAVLGEMRELGPDAPAEHAKVIGTAAELGVYRVLATGDGAQSYPRTRVTDGDHDASGGFVAVHAGIDSAVRELEAGLRPGDAVLIKASNAVGLAAVARALLGTGTGDESDSDETGDAQASELDSGPADGQDDEPHEVPDGRPTERVEGAA